MITTNFYLPRLPHSVGLRTPNSTAKTPSFVSIARMTISGAMAQGQLPDYSRNSSNSDITPTQPPRVIYRVDHRTFDPSTPIVTPSHFDLPGSISNEPITPAVAQSGDLKPVQSNLSNDNERPQVLVKPKAAYSAQPHPDNQTTPLQPSCGHLPGPSVTSLQTSTVPPHSRISATCPGSVRYQPPARLATPVNHVPRSSLAADLANTPQAMPYLPRGEPRDAARPQYAILARVPRLAHSHFDKFLQTIVCTRL